MLVAVSVALFMFCLQGIFRVRWPNRRRLLLRCHCRLFDQTSNLCRLGNEWHVTRPDLGRLRAYPLGVERLSFLRLDEQIFTLELHEPRTHGLLRWTTKDGARGHIELA